jgi:deoxyribose-phosphate aldolase
MLRIPAICLTNTRASWTQAVCTFLELTADYWKTSTGASRTQATCSFYWTADYWKTSTGASRTQATCSFNWTADYWKTSTGASRTQATCSFTGRQITGKQAQELHVLRLLVLLLDGGLTRAQDGRKASTCLCIQTF